MKWQGEKRDIRLLMLLDKLKKILSDSKFHHTTLQE